MKTKGLEFLQAHLSASRTVVQTRGKHVLDAVVLKPTLQLKQRAIAGSRGCLTFGYSPALHEHHRTNALTRTKATNLRATPTNADAILSCNVLQTSEFVPESKHWQ